MLSGNNIPGVSWLLLAKDDTETTSSSWNVVQALDTTQSEEIHYSEFLVSWYSTTFWRASGPRRGVFCCRLKGVKLKGCQVSVVILILQRSWPTMRHVIIISTEKLYLNCYGLLVWFILHSHPKGLRNASLGCFHQRLRWSPRALRCMTTCCWCGDLVLSGQ